MRSRRMLAAGGLLLLVLASACDEDTAEPTGAATSAPALTSPVAVDRDAILNELAEVRALFEQQSSLDAGVLRDVSFEDGQLTVVLDDTNTDLDQAEQICQDLGEAIQVADVRIQVNAPDGSSLASCAFNA